MNRPLEAALDWALAILVAPILALYFGLFDLAQRVVVKVARRHHPALVRLWARALIALMRFVWRARVEIEPLPPEIAARDRPMVIVANHRSPADMALMFVLFGGDTRFVARPGLDRGTPCLSFYLRSGGGVTLRRGAGAANLDALRSYGRAIDAEKATVVIFAEGVKDARRYDQLDRFHLGGALALLAGAPDAQVVPVAISGSQGFWKAQLRPPRRGASIRVKAFAPVTRAGGDREAVKECERTIADALSPAPSRGERLPATRREADACASPASH